MKYEMILGDAFKLLPTMADASVDHVITDPPYSEQVHVGARTLKDLDSKLVDFNSINEADFLQFCAEAVRIAKRWVIMTCDFKHIVAAQDAGLPVIRCGVWVKPNAAPQFTGDRPGTGFETVLILHREGKKRWHGGGHHAVWTTNRINADYHSTQKPLPLIKKWIAQFTDIGETILDPFAGSGTTGVACIQTSRNFKGIEISPIHHATATKRIQDAAAQPMLLEVA
jgi:site-specific DNA-methyltransferase (adenine-specific)